jgi:hypothetical protein
LRAKRLFESASARTERLSAIKGPFIGCRSCFDGSDRPKTARKAVGGAAPGERSLQARQNRGKERRGDETVKENVKIAFDFVAFDFAPKPEAIL